MSEEKIVIRDKVILLPDGKLKEFDNIGISTKTVIALTNLHIDLDKYFLYAPITDYMPVEKKRGRKKRYSVQPAVLILPYGSIISVQKRNAMRGAILKNKQKNKSFFLHSVTTVFMLNDNKMINVKVSSNGRFQMTGCKNDSHYVETIIILMKTLKDIEQYSGEKIWNFTDDSDKLNVTFNTVMQNMDFNIGFYIKRNKLDYFINTGTEFRSIFEGSISTGVNIKIPSASESEEKLLKISYDHSTDIIEKSLVPYSNYYNSLEAKEKRKEERKEKHHTFLVFSSGSIIMSSRGSDMKRVFESLTKTLVANRKEFEDIATPEECIKQLASDTECEEVCEEVC
jgi:TATA-box binding protein (TBP) (component of TFIID and TFIIIB)